MPPHDDHLRLELEHAERAARRAERHSRLLILAVPLLGALLLGGAYFGLIRPYQASLRPASVAADDQLSRDTAAQLAATREQLAELHDRTERARAQAAREAELARQAAQAAETAQSSRPSRPRPVATPTPAPSAGMQLGLDDSDDPLAGIRR